MLFPGIVDFLQLRTGCCFHTELTMSSHDKCLRAPSCQLNEMFKISTILSGIKKALILLGCPYFFLSFIFDNNSNNNN